MSIGGFNGTDPSPTLAQFQAYVAQHKIHYFIAGGGGLRWWRRFGWRWRSGGIVGDERDHAVGREHLHRADHRQRDGLRPHDGAVATGNVIRATVPPPSRPITFDGPALELDDLFHDREPEARARASSARPANGRSGRTRARGPRPESPGRGRAPRSSRRATTTSMLLLGGRELARVVDEVRHRALDRAQPDRDERGIVERQPDRSLVAAAEAIDDAVGELAEVDRLRRLFARAHRSRGRRARSPTR